MKSKKPDQKRQPNQQRRQGPVPSKKSEDVFNYAVRRLDYYGDTSEALLREVLKRKTDNQGWIDEAIARLIDINFLSDSRYAESIVHNGVANKKWGKKRIQMELQKKRIPSDIASDALEALADEDPVARATEALKGRFRGRPIEDQKEKSRAAGFLARRGFDPGSIFPAIDRHNESIDQDIY